MNNYKLIFKPFGAHSILVEWPAKINKNILYDVLRFKKIISNKYFKQKVYITNAYNSLLINYDSSIENIYDKIKVLEKLYYTKDCINKITFKQWNIPVCYDKEFGIDLKEISIKNELSEARIVKLHSQTIYTVFFVGFLPGFLYLGGLDKQLHFPRKKSPRLDIKKGAVGIGEQQTGIYPETSPGGWNIIGNSPINFFDIHKKESCFAKAGDSIKFFSVSKQEYLSIKKEVNNGVYRILNNFTHD